MPCRTASTCCSLSPLPRVLYRQTECQSAWDKVSGSRQQLFRTAACLCLHGRGCVGKWSACGAAQHPLPAGHPRLWHGRPPQRPVAACRTASQGPARPGHAAQDRRGERCPLGESWEESIVKVDSFFLPQTSNPARPVPSRRKVPGSGIAVIL